MGVGKRIIGAFKGEEELRVVFWKGVAPVTIVVLLLVLYAILPFFGYKPVIAIVFTWLLLSAFLLKRCWTNCSVAFHEEITTVLKFLGVVWIAAVLMSPIFYMLYIQK